MRSTSALRPSARSPTWSERSTPSARRLGSERLRSGLLRLRLPLLLPPRPVAALWRCGRAHEHRAAGLRLARARTPATRYRLAATAAHFADAVRRTAELVAERTRRGHPVDAGVRCRSRGGLPHH